MDREPAVYLLASAFHGTLYTGVTSTLLTRLHQHRSATTGFTARYKVHRLVWFEGHDRMETAIAREKSVKRWLRDWKYALIAEQNPTWRDLAEDFGFEPLVRRQGGPGSSPG